MTTTAAPAPPSGPRNGVGRRLSRSLSRHLSRHPRVQLGGLLSAPMLWLGLIYLGSLGALLLTSLYTTDDFTGAVVKTFSLQNFQDLLSNPTFRAVTIRTVVIAVAVTVIDLALALPFAFFLAKVASRRTRRALAVALVLPLWASYLVKAYAWRTMLAEGGVLNWALGPVGGHGPGFGLVATTVTLAYLWLPYMILPIYAGLERLPDSLLEASGDLGATAGRTFASVVLPLLFPSIVAGSIFTFSLSLGDYIAVKIVGGSSQLFANVIYDNIGVAGNLPFAAAAATFPVLAILLYLTLVRRTGALDNL